MDEVLGHGQPTIGEAQRAAAGQDEPSLIAVPVLRTHLDARLADQPDQFGRRAQVALDDDVRGRVGRFGGVRPGALGTVAVVVPALPALAAEPAGLDQAALGQGRGEAHVLEERLPHGVRDGLVDVLPDEVGQFEGAHPEAAGLA